MKDSADEFVESCRDYIKSNRLLSPGQRVLVGLSGGVDSVSLAHVLHSLGYKVSLVHVNYGLRGKESDLDEKLVREFSRSLGLSLSVHDRRQTMQDAGGNIQVQARNERYRIFDRLARENEISTVAVGHHADDLVETILHNIVAGRHLFGHEPAPVSRPICNGSNVTLIRPLRNMRRNDIIQYATTHSLKWREDSSNLEEKYSRSRIRMDVIPGSTRSLGFDMAETILRYDDKVISLIRDETSEATAKLIAEIYDSENQRLYLGLVDDVQRPHLDESMRRIIEDMASYRFPVSDKLIARVKGLASSQVGRKVIFPGGIAIRERGYIQFKVTEERSEEPGQVELHLDSEVDFAGYTFSSVTDSNTSVVDDTSFVFDPSAVSWPLTIRMWQSGDRIRPFGMRGSKKVSDILTDHKINSADRADVPVVLSESDILWVVGVRRSSAALVQPKSEFCCRVQAQKKKLSLSMLK